MLLLSKDDIRSVVSMKDMIESCKTAFRMAAEGTCETPLRTVINARMEDSAFLFMPAYAPAIDTASLKVVNIFPHNPAKGLMSAPGQVLLIDGETGYIKALIDGTCVTQLRTGGSTGAAFDLLARRDSRKGALIGTGGQAPAQLEAMLTGRDLEEIRIYDLDPDRCETFTLQMREAFAYHGTKLIPVEDPDECVEDADLIVTVTVSPEPVFDGAKAKAGATISAVGTYQPHKHELDPLLLPRASKIVCDSVDAVLSESGDLLIPMEQGIITRDDIYGSLGDIVAGRLPGRESDEEIIVYETVGIATQDLIAAKTIYDKAVETGVGTNWG